MEPATYENACFNILVIRANAHSLQHFLKALRKVSESEIAKEANAIR
jgi:metal-responsive CopG/Arc/MetJ family transcriptional regulator